MSRMKDIPRVDRPREKFLERGADALSKTELLAILLGSGIKGANAKVLAQKILRKFDAKFLHATVDDLTKVSGVGKAKALQITAAFALVRRIREEQENSDDPVCSAKDALALVPELRKARKEHLVCL